MVGTSNFIWAKRGVQSQLLEAFLESDSILGAEVHQRKDRVSERSGGEACSGATDLLRRRRLLLLDASYRWRGEQICRGALRGVFFFPLAHPHGGAWILYKSLHHPRWQDDAVRDRGWVALARNFLGLWVWCWSFCHFSMFNSDVLEYPGWWLEVL